MSTTLCSGRGLGHYPTLVVDVCYVSEQVKEEAIKAILEEFGINKPSTFSFTKESCGYWFLRETNPSHYQLTQTAIAEMEEGSGGIKAYVDSNSRTGDYIIVKLEELLA
ncbi:hypothetical protein [Vibrio phage MJW]